MRRQRIIIALAALLWTLSIAAGYRKVLAYTLTPGVAATPPARWPSSIRFLRNPVGPTVVMLIHPHCPCSRASLTQLSQAMASRPGARAYLFFLRPEGMDAEWTKTGAWRMAERIPGAIPLIDDRGLQAGLFGAHTSGQVVVYDAAGKLAFSGGITPSRGHLGDNAGQQQLVALLRGEKVDRTDSLVFGCSLQDAPERTVAVK